MDKMSPLSILAVSVPEMICSIYLCFLITGEKIHLFLDDKINVIRLAIAVSLMVASSVILRAFLPEMVLFFLVNMLIITIIFMVTYKMKWYKAAINSLILYGFLISIEIVYAPIFLKIADISVEQMQNSDGWRILYSIPMRGIQLFLIISLWNWNKVVFNIKEYKEVRVTFFIFMTLLLSIELLFVLIFLNNFSDMESHVQWVYMGGFSLFSVLNFSLFKLLSVFTNAIVRKDLAEYINSKREARSTMESIATLLEKGEIEQAKSLCREYNK